MSEYFAAAISPRDMRARKKMDALLEAEGIA